MSTSINDSLINDSETAVTSLIFRDLKPNEEKPDKIFGKNFIVLWKYAQDSTIMEFNRRRY